MYSIVPMPKIEWKKEYMKYTFVFFPFVGLLIGVVMYFWIALGFYPGLNSLLVATVLSLIPVVVSGGIHIDGLIDTCDAIFSYGDKEKKLEILKDPRTGAFGVIGCVLYFILTIGIYSQFLESPKILILILFPFFISRCIGGLNLLIIKKARTTGLASTFSSAAGRKTNLVFLSVFLVFSFFAIGIINIYIAVVSFLFCLIFTICFFRFMLKNFGGITGDLTGFIISVTEIMMLLIMSIGGIIC